MLLKILSLKILNIYLRKNKFLVKLLFDVKIPDGERIYWDFTTLTLKKALNNYVTPQSRVLEIGTGPYALLSVYLSKKYGCLNTASDINKNYILASKKSLEKNECNFEIFKSDLFENISSRYDIIFFNTVYISRKEGIRIGLNRMQKYESDWCGGENGFEVTEKFLSAAKLHLRPSGNVLLGFNPSYSNSAELKEMCIKYGYKIIHETKQFINPSVVLILK